MIVTATETESSTVLMDELSVFLRVSTSGKSDADCENKKVDLINSVIERYSVSPNRLVKVDTTDFGVRSIDSLGIISRSYTCTLFIKSKGVGILESILLLNELCKSTGNSASLSGWKISLSESYKGTVSETVINNAYGKAVSTCSCLFPRDTVLAVKDVKITDCSCTYKPIVVDLPDNRYGARDVIFDTLLDTSDLNVEISKSVTVSVEG